MKNINRVILFLILLTNLLALTACKEAMMNLRVKAPKVEELKVTITSQGGLQANKEGTDAVEFKKLPAGEYSLEITAKGYFSEKRMITLDKSQILKVELKKKYANLKVRGQGIKDLKVLIVGKDNYNQDISQSKQGQEEVEFPALKTGQYLVYISGKNYESKSQLINLEDDYLLEINDLKKELVTLRVRVPRVEGQRVILYGQGYNNSNVYQSRISDQGGFVEFTDLMLGKYIVFFENKFQEKAEKSLLLTKDQEISFVTKDTYKSKENPQKQRTNTNTITAFKGINFGDSPEVVEKKLSKFAPQQKIELAGKEFLLDFEYQDNFLVRLKLRSSQNYPAEDFTSVKEDRNLLLNWLKAQYGAPQKLPAKAIGIDNKSLIFNYLWPADLLAAEKEIKLGVALEKKVHYAMLWIQLDNLEKNKKN